MPVSGPRLSVVLAALLVPSALFASYLEVSRRLTVASYVNGDWLALGVSTLIGASILRGTRSTGAAATVWVVAFASMVALWLLFFGFGFSCLRFDTCL